MTEPVFKVFPLSGWKGLKRIPKPRKPTKMCPEMSYVEGSFWELRGTPPNQVKHGGIDIFCPEGTPIVSPVDGVVWQNIPQGDVKGKHVYWDKGGWHLYLKSDDGFIYYFAHMKQIPLVLPGERVTAGQLVGYVGVSGNSGTWKNLSDYEARKGKPTTCPHLHFQMYKTTAAGAKGAVVNPYPYLRKAQPITLATKILGGALGLLLVGGGGFFFYKWLKKRRKK